MIQATGLTKIYIRQKRTGWWTRRREEIAAVQDLDLELAGGQIVGLLGLNGAGKTTTIKMLATLLEPTRGRAEVDGLDVVRRAGEVRRLVNVIAGGERMLYWRLTGRENLWYFAQLYDVPRPLVEPRIKELLDLVGLAEHADTPVEKYSKGMKQRLQFARGLINDPKYIFMDEPTLGLDAPIARELRAFVRQLSGERGKGILLTSHYMAEVEELCDYIHVIHKGRKVAEGTAADLRRQTADRFKDGEPTLEDAIIALTAAPLAPAAQAANPHAAAGGGCG